MNRVSQLRDKEWNEAARPETHEAAASRRQDRQVRAGILKTGKGDGQATGRRRWEWIRHGGHTRGGVGWGGGVVVSVFVSVLVWPERLRGRTGLAKISHHERGGEGRKGGV